jgi:hypothetical protein
MKVKIRFFHLASEKNNTVYHRSTMKGEIKVKEARTLHVGMYSNIHKESEANASCIIDNVIVMILKMDWSHASFHKCDNG